MRNVIIPKKISNKDIIKFFKSKNMNSIILSSKEYHESVNDMTSDYKYKPQLKDLYRLYQFVILNKRTTILEFGSGWSTLIFSIALNELKKKYSQQIKKLRRNNPFELFILENEKKFLNITKKRINKFYKKQKNKPKIHYKFSEVEMVLFNKRFVRQTLVVRRFLLLKSTSGCCTGLRKYICLLF